MYFPYNSVLLFLSLGDHTTNANEGFEQEIQVKRIVVHPQYYDITNDIALLELSRPAMYNKFVQPVCLPGKHEKPAIGSECFITGIPMIGANPSTSLFHIQ